MNDTANATDSRAASGADGTRRADDHHIVISADTHCGAELYGYKPYLESKYHDDFDHWAASMEADTERRKELFKDMERSPLEVGVDGDPDECGDRYCSRDRRLPEQEPDGVTPAVLPPTNHPPSLPAAARPSAPAPLPGGAGLGEANPPGKGAHALCGAPHPGADDRPAPGRIRPPADDHRHPPFRGDPVLLVVPYPLDCAEPYALVPAAVSDERAHVQPVP